MIKRWLTALLLLFTGLIVFADSDYRLGFGLQPGIVQPPINPNTLNRRILSATRYKLTPGDSYELVTILDETERYPLLLSNDYLLDIPYLGTINVEGMYFSELKRTIVKQINATIPFQFVDFVLTAPALFDIFIHGGVIKPGIATVNPLARVSDAILLAGGLMNGGSFRTIELLRGGSQQVLDLSRFVSQADFSQNPLLEPGDRIYIPPAERIVEITGKVRYPGIYELLPGEGLTELLIFCGGTTPYARSQKIRINRIMEEGQTALLTVAALEKTELFNSDMIMVASSLENRDMITVDGALYGAPVAGDTAVTIPASNIVINLPYTSGMSLLELLDLLGGPTPLAQADQSYIQRRGQRVAVDVQALWRTRQSHLDLKLEPNDLLVVPRKKTRIVVTGEVNIPDAVPFTNGGKVYDYILAAGGINKDSGSKNSIFFIDELGRREKVRLDAEVRDPGTLIYVGRNPWGSTTKVLADILVITGFVAAIISITNSILDFAARF